MPKGPIGKPRHTHANTAVYNDPLQLHLLFPNHSFKMPIFCSKHAHPHTLNTAGAGWLSAVPGGLQWRGRGTERCFGLLAEPLASGQQAPAPPWPHTGGPNIRRGGGGVGEEGGGLKRAKETYKDLNWEHTFAAVCILPTINLLHAASQKLQVRGGGNIKRWKGWRTLTQWERYGNKNTHSHISSPEPGPSRFVEVGQHTCSFWANAVGLVSARSGSRYCRGSSHSDSLSNNRGMAWAGAGATTGPWPEGYRGTRRSGQRDGIEGGGDGTAQQSKRWVFEWQLISWTKAGKKCVMGADFWRITVIQVLG